MSPGFPLPALLAYLSVCVSVTGNVLEVRSVRGSDCILLCPAGQQPGVQYRAVRWYKVNEPPSPRLSGLLTRHLPNGTTQWYAGVERRVELVGTSRDVLLPNVTCEDSGRYACYLAAPVGEQNREGPVRLTVTGCSETSDSHLVLDATVMLALALLIFLISYVCLKKTLSNRYQTAGKETLLDAPLKPLQKEDLMWTHSLGPPTIRICT